jgi:hypothetical protein
MKVEKAVVEYRHETPQAGYKITVYIGLQVDSGPDFQVLLTSLQELYSYFMTHEKSESYKMAEFCLRNGYNVLAQRVNNISGRGSCRKFIIPTETISREEFFSPRENQDYSDIRSFNITGGFYTTEGDIEPLCSAIVRIKEGNFDNQYINDFFKLMVPIRIVDDEGNSKFSIHWLLGCKADTSNLGTFDHIRKLQSSLKYNDLRSTLENFFLIDCGFHIEQFGDYIYVRSDSMIQCFVPTNFTIVNDQIEEEVLEIVPSGIGLQDNRCFMYNDYKVCTIYTKYDSCIYDTKVSIVKSSGYYYVTVYKFNNENSLVITENFNYSTDPSSLNYIRNLSRDSNLVDLEIYDETADLSGTYELKGRTNLSSSSDYVDSITPLEEGEYELTYNADICLDMSENNQSKYVELLKNNFPNSIIFTDYDKISTDIKETPNYSRVVAVNPRVIWTDTKDNLKGFSLLLYMIKENANMSDSSIVQAEQVSQNYLNTFLIEKDDYEVMLMGVNSSVSENSSRFPIRTALTVMAIENLIVTSAFQNEREFRDVVENSTKTVNDFLTMNVKVEVVEVSIVRSRLKAMLTFSVDNMIISSYRIVATILE